MTAPTTFHIEFIGEKTIPVEEGESVLEAALKAGIPHYHTCGGHARCSTCRILVSKGKENISAINEKEAALREQLPFPSNVRLACQTFIEKTPVSIHRIIRDLSDVNLYIDQSENDFNELGEEKELVLFFLDIRDFTPFMETYLAFDVIHILRKLFSLFRTCIENGGGKIIETAGDGLYAVFGLRCSPETAAMNAIESGFAIFKELENFNKEYVQKHFRHRFQIGIGMHCGNVIVGNVGLGINNNLTVMGLPVNIASRIQSATKDLNNSFLLSEDVLKQAGTKEYPSSVLTMKGITDPIQVHLLGEPYYSASSFCAKP
ncbi:MAG TPA: adenylate/guanylate cyclase domain-containing protein [Flavisolibacter sp.]|jgi:adenylate cyclase|nr:adenylate/guanylate cyclase domain-containing protein [Flavisolibacter sp.]